jgi:SAM-dependent methyltransferase
MTDIVATAPAELVRHRFLGRTLSTGRWQEYDTLLAAARRLGWTTMALEDWVEAQGVGGRVLIIRHDVDQHPAMAVRMARIEARHGVHGTWYFRWRTSSPAAIRRIRELGGGVGFHYETLTRMALELGIGAGDIDAALVATAREELRREVAAFAMHFGTLTSICAHGDTRVPRVTNQVLVRGEDPGRFGVRFDANEALSRHRLGVWLTDRSAADGGWNARTDPLTWLRDGADPVLLLTHPNNWCSGPSLWADRLARAALPSPPRDRGRWRIGMRTGSDRPPAEGLAGPGAGPLVSSPQLRTATTVRSFAPVAESLRREILRFSYDRGERLVTESGVRTLETNSGLAESRAATLEHVLRCARMLTLRDRDVVDLGCGFGALALVFATRGARVTALDPNAVRLTVGARVAEQHGLQITWRVGGMDTAELGEERFDIALMNNSFCYLVARSSRRAALDRALAALRPGGVLVIRNPSRFRLRDQFTGLPLVGMLPPRAARAIGRLTRRNRSDVRLLSSSAARRELRRAGFVAVQSIAPPGHSRRTIPFAAYHHVVARRPGR